jgi:hypothetical protein
MSSNTEHQQVVSALIDESEKSASSKKVEQKSKIRRSKKNYCTEDYIVGYGVPVLIAILLILFFILVPIAIRKYNENCVHTKGTSCRGMM